MAATAFPAAAIVSGTIATPRLGSGTADATSFLRGDSTWAVVPEVTRASLGLATTDSPTFAGATFSGTLQAATIQGATTLSLKTAGTTRADYNITATASWTFVSSAFNVGSNVRVPATNFFFWQSRSVILSPADGQIQFLTQNGSNFSALILGPATASFPSIRRNGTAINFRLADDSADAPITASNALFYKVNTSATSYEALQIDATGDASNFDIAASIGSAGGTARGIRIGGKDAAGTFTSWMSFATTGGATFSSFINATSIRCDGSQVLDTSGTLIDVGSAGGFLSCKLLNNFSNAVKLIVGSSSTTLSPAIHVPAATNAIAFKSADGTIDTPISAASGTFSGALQIGNAAVAETPVATHTLIIKDSTGTSYRVLAVAV